MSETAQEAFGSMLTENILSEAIDQGYSVNDDTVAALKAKKEPEPEKAPESVESQDALDKVIAGFQSEASEMVGDDSDDEEEVEETPDWEAEAERQILDEEIAAVEAGYDDEDDSPEAQAARKRAIIAEKKAAYYEKREAERGRKRWEAEALKHYPLAAYAIPNIKATSRRKFIAEAKRAHETVKPYLNAAMEDREKQLAAKREALAAEEKAKAVDAWGKPVNDPGTPVSRYQERIEEARRKNPNDLAARIAMMMQAESEGGEAA